uniref:hypothetical protein n=1 Tax=Aliarcobacter sp. TaxID=2321116 RepID=UPI004048C42B
MKKFKELEESLQNELIDICKDDPYNLNPEFLYMNIFPELLNRIKEEGKNKNIK